MAINSLNFPIISPPESPLAALLKNAIDSYNTIQNVKSENIKRKYIEPTLQNQLAMHSAALQEQQIKNQYLPQSLQANLSLERAKLLGENIQNKYLPQMLESKIHNLINPQPTNLSTVAKLQRDYNNAVQQYGEDSLQANELKSAIEKQSSPANVQTRRAAEEAMEPYVNSIYELLPDVKKYFGLGGKFRKYKDIAVGSNDIEKLRKFQSDLQLFEEEAARLVNLPADQEARKAFKKAFDFDSWMLNPNQAERSLKQAIEKVKEAGKLSTVPGYKSKSGKKIIGSDGKEYSLEELQKIAGGSQ